MLDEQLLASSRVGMSDCVSAVQGEHQLVSRLTGDATPVRVRRRVVDAGYLKPSIPMTHVPSFAAEPGVQLIPVNDLVRLDAPASGFTVIGAGKTAMDACLWLLEADVPPEAVDGQAEATAQASSWVSAGTGADDVDPVGPASAPMLSWSRRQEIRAWLMSRMKCLATFRLLMTFPALIPILPASLTRPAATWAAILPRSASVAASRSSRVRTRLAASNGLRQAISRSPGKSGEVI